MKQLGMQDFTDQASIGLLGITGRKAKGGGPPTRYEKFIEAVRLLPPPPCKGCPLRDKCAKQQLACEQFWQYVHSMEGKPAAWIYDTPPTREPTKRIYKLLSADDDKRRPQLRRVTRKRFNGYLADEIVREIRKQTGPTTRIARALNLSTSVVRRIRAGLSYDWVA